MTITISAGVLARWGHDDPDEARREMWEALGDLSAYEIFGTQVLLADYMRPSTTKGGVITPGTAQNEDVLQGTIGMIALLGPLAFPADEDAARFHGRAPAVGDFVYCRPQDTVMCHIRGIGSTMQVDKIAIKSEDERTGDVVETGRFREERRRQFEGWPCRLVYARDIYARVKLPHTIV